MPSEKNSSQRGRHARNKGRRGELAAREPLFLLTGFEWERGARQSRVGGGEGNPDLVPVDGRPCEIHPEVKVGAKPPLLPGLEQAITDAHDGVIPICLAKRDRGEWVMALRVDDFWDLVEVLSKTRNQ